MTHTSINPWTLYSWKNSTCSMPINKVICWKSMWMAKKSTHFQNKGVHNLEILGGIYKKNATLFETLLLKNLKKDSSLSSKNLESWHQKSSNGKEPISCKTPCLSVPLRYASVASQVNKFAEIGFLATKWLVFYPGHKEIHGKTGGLHWNRVFSALSKVFGPILQLGFRDSVLKVPWCIRDI